MRIISIEPDRQRLGLSLKEVSEDERARWQERLAAEADTSSPDEAPVMTEDEAGVENVAAVQ